MLSAELPGEVLSTTGLVLMHEEGPSLIVPEVVVLAALPFGILALSEDAASEVMVWPSNARGVIVEVRGRAGPSIRALRISCPDSVIRR